MSHNFQNNPVTTKKPDQTNQFYQSNRYMSYLNTCKQIKTCLCFEVTLKKQFSLCLILIVALFLSSRSYSFERTNKIDQRMHKIFATQIESQYKSEFKYNVKVFNSKNTTVADVEKLYGKKISRDGSSSNMKLPKIILKEEVATLIIGKNKIFFTPKSLFEGHVFLNDKKLNITQISLSNVQKILKESNKVTNFDTVLGFIISEAYAEQDKFEVLIFSSLIAIQYNFDTSWCFFDSCEKEKGRSNFERVMLEMKKQATDCDLYGTEPSLIDDMAQFQSNSNLQEDLSDKLENAFSGYSANELTCQRFVENYHQEEIAARTSRVERRGYGGVLSITAEENAQLNKADFDAYVADTCQPYVDLRNCMVRGHRQAAAIHDDARGEGKTGEWRNYIETYQTEARTGATQR